MKNLFILLCFTLLSCATTNAAPLQTIENLDIKRYTGGWHQIAIIPNRFQKMCYANTTATYKILPPNRKGISHIEVNNTCLESDGEINTIFGKARVNPKKDSTAKLEVSFAKIFGKTIWLAAGDYWVLDIGKNYDYVVIGEPKRKFGWVLARKLQLSDSTLSNIRQLLTEQGYNPCEFEMSRNIKINEEQMPTLCEYLDN